MQYDNVYVTFNTKFHRDIRSLILEKNQIQQ